ncbi:MAG: phage transcriptional regulator, AlpA [Acidimicrobiaceae bacterium]|nr:phage transcriptional regulator, AlpA [Acidimicrobiaceae bacterium]
MGLAEIATLLDVSRSRADQLARTKDFPDPRAELRAGRVWRTEDVLRWMERTGRIAR